MDDAFAGLAIDEVAEVALLVVLAAAVAAGLAAVGEAVLVVVVHPAISIDAMTIKRTEATSNFLVTPFTSLIACYGTRRGTMNSRVA